MSRKKKTLEKFSRRKKLEEVEIRENTNGHSTYVEGLVLFEENAVKTLKFDKKKATFYAIVKDYSKAYETSMKTNEAGDILDYECQCSFHSYGMCSHLVATAKAIQSTWHKAYGVKMSPQVNFMLNKYSSIYTPIQNDGNIGTNISIVPTLHVETKYDAQRSWLEFKIGHKRKYVMKNVQNFIESVHAQKSFYFGKEFVYDPTCCHFDETSEKLLAMIEKIYLDEVSTNHLSNPFPYYQYNTPNRIFHSKEFHLSLSSIESFLEIMKNTAFDMIINGRLVKDVTFQEGRPPIELKVGQIEGGYKIDLADKETGFIQDQSSYFYHNQSIYQVDERFKEYASPLFKCLNESRKNRENFVKISDKASQEFFSNVLPTLSEFSTVKIQSKLKQMTYSEPLHSKLYFDKYKKGISAEVIFQYGDIKINPANDIEPKIGKDGKTLVRKLKEETYIQNLLKQFQFEKKDSLYTLEDEAYVYDFLEEGLPKLQKNNEVFYTQAFKNLNIKKAENMGVGLRLSSDSDMLELSFEFDELDPEEMMEILASYKIKKKYYKLKDGQFLSLDSPSLETMADIVEQLQLKKSDLKKNMISLPKYRALYLEKLTRDSGSLQVKRSSYFKQLIQDVTEPQDLDYSLPEGINGRLRDYQITGYKWLKMLSYYGFGGILADDMGLGKTLQVITFIQSFHQYANEPSLVVAPTSLVYNWKDEVEKFAPNLKVVLLAGNKEEREEKINELQGYDVVITSYGKLKRDIEFYADIKFHYCFIDEAQHIKNPTTLNAKSVKGVNAKGFYALTGTPIENSLTELWSIFDFIMPGYLYSHGQFMKKFEKPIIKNGDEKSLQNLAKHINPFIMRRLKKDVLKELPDKIESKMINEMEKEQQKLYIAHQMKAREEFAKEIQENGFEKSRIKILAILTRLRQICCHPSLFIENFIGKSGKLEMLKELIQEGISGGHKMLIFSQFTSMLALIKDELETLNIGYHYLDGRTKAEDRIELVKDFNANTEKKVFLISLKAGGTGLNLTGADMVIHVDPWWNPAIEDQATDRTYRIGQNKAVQVFKLITKDTIEEKIYLLQQKKKELIDSLIKPGETMLNKLSEDEIRNLFEV
jgi:SNF2 family DNA or RNA helicase